MKKIWFKRKLYGWGWTPVTWQGWALIILYMIIVIGVPLGMAFFFDFKEEPEKEPLMGLVTLGVIVITTPLLIWISYKKGEKPQWQWGEREEEENSTPRE